MFPGYGDCPYHSPVRVDSVEPVGGRQLELTFLNLGYATGVQHFEKRLLTLQRGSSHFVAAETGTQDRTYVFVQLNFVWVKRHFPNLQANDLFDANGEPKDEALLRLSSY